MDFFVLLVVVSLIFFLGVNVCFVALRAVCALWLVSPMSLCTMRSFCSVMMLETILIVGMVVACTLIMGVGGVMVSHIYSNIAIAKAEIAESEKTRRERINVRADLAFDDDVCGDGDTPAAGGSELDSLARLLGYSDAGSALADPAVLLKLGLSTPKPKTEVE